MLIHCEGKPADLYDDTNPDWVPTQKIGYKSGHQPDNDRYCRAMNRKRHRLEMQAEEENIIVDDDLKDGSIADDDDDVEDNTLEDDDAEDDDMENVILEDEIKAT